MGVSASLLFSLAVHQAAKSHTPLDPTAPEVVEFCLTSCVKRLIRVAHETVMKSCGLDSTWSYLAQMLHTCPLVQRTVTPSVPPTSLPTVTPSVPPSEPHRRIDIKLVLVGAWNESADERRWTVDVSAAASALSEALSL